MHPRSCVAFVTEYMRQRRRSSAANGGSTSNHPINASVWAAKHIKTVNQWPFSVPEYCSESIFSTKFSHQRPSSTTLDIQNPSSRPPYEPREV